MKIAWIKFHGIYSDCRFEVGKDGVCDLYIERYSTEPYCGRAQLCIACDDGAEKVRSLDGANYDFQQAGAA